MNYLKKYKFLLCMFLLINILLLTGCEKEKKTVSKTGFYFDTIIQITIYDDSNEQLIDDCFSMADQYERLFSKTITDSDIYRINQAAGSPVLVDDETISLLQMGISYGRLSEGAFDITIGALSDLWNFKENSGTIPSATDIAAAISSISYENISIRKNEVTLLHPDARIDLGAIAKGYIADKMKAYLNSQGIREGVINLGGNVLTLGSKSDGSSYTIGIQKPFDEEGSSIASVEIIDGTVVSSGTYERYFEVDGVIYHHILNPATGYPYDNGLLSVTIICPDSVDGDGLSTTGMALGLTEGISLIEGIKDTEAIFITDDYKLHISSGLEDAVTILE